MSARAVAFVFDWIHQRASHSAPSPSVGELTVRCKQDAGVAGITETDLNEAFPNLAESIEAALLAYRDTKAVQETSEPANPEPKGTAFRKARASDQH